MTIVTAPGQLAPSADVHGSAQIGARSRVWDLAQIRADARIGADCVIGRGAYVGVGVRIGDKVKIQNYALVYEPAVIADGVFIGPAAAFTNDLYPRAVTPTGAAKTASDWTPQGVVVGEGASIGARAVCVAPITIGRWAMVAAGAVVTTNVPDFALMVGVPARRVGWVGRAGVPLVPDQVIPDVAAVSAERFDGAGLAGGESVERWRCPATGAIYHCDAEQLREERA